MPRYLPTRLAATIPMLVGVTVVIFVMVRLIPGDHPRFMLGEGMTDEQVVVHRHEIGYDDPSEDPFDGR